MSARCAPRLVGASAWISSTITASTSRSVSRACDVSIRYSDSGVVMRRSGGWRTQPAALVGRGVAGAHARPVGSVQRHAEALGREPDAGQRGRAGSSRRRRPAPAAARCRGAACRACRSGQRRGSSSRSMPQRNAASVLPEPVGAQDQRVLAGRDGRPALGLGRGGLGERRREPRAHRRGELLHHPAQPTNGVSQSFSDGGAGRRRRTRSVALVIDCPGIRDNQCLRQGSGPAQAPDGERPEQRQLHGGRGAARGGWRRPESRTGGRRRRHVRRPAPGSAGVTTGTYKTLVFRKAAVVSSTKRNVVVSERTLAWTPDDSPAALVDARRALREPPRHRPRQHDPQRRPADARRGPARHRQPAAVDRRRLHPGVRQPAAHRGHARRQVRPPGRPDDAAWPSSASARPSPRSAAPPAP